MKLQAGKPIPLASQNPHCQLIHFSVDANTQALVQNIIDVEYKDCTVLAVIHRLDLIQKYDKVALLDSGVLVEYDTPAELLAGPSRLSELHSSGGH
jgi:ATP-binding cassette subfamily C (CFTR/MRP) protein 1